MPCPPTVGRGAAWRPTGRTRSRRRRGTPAASAGCVPSTPESELPTTMPAPSTPSSLPDPSAPHQPDVPGRPRSGAGASPPACAGGRRQRAQPLADQHPGHLRPPGQPRPHRRAAVHLDRVDQVVRRRTTRRSRSSSSAQVALRAFGGRPPAAGRPPAHARPAPPAPASPAGNRAEVGLLAQHHEQPLAVAARLAGHRCRPPRRPAPAPRPWRRRPAAGARGRGRASSSAVPEAPGPADGERDAGAPPPPRTARRGSWRAAARSPPGR